MVTSLRRGASTGGNSEVPRAETLPLISSSFCKFSSLHIMLRKSVNERSLNSFNFK